MAIIIPAYKTRFFAQTLESLARQTVKDFTVYVGDDNSSEDVAVIVDRYRGRLNINYKKFSHNLGQKDLVAHWKRCIGMTSNESWFWILPDDDTASPECVETFLAQAAGDQKKEKLYRFQTRYIDEEGQIIYQPSLCPPVEGNVDFILKKLRFERNSSVAEYIFSSGQYHEKGGFEHLPLAWGADDLLWTNLADPGGIITLPRGLVNLRQSNLNISNSPNYSKEKLEARYLFLEKLLASKSFAANVAATERNLMLQQAITFHLFTEYKSYRKKFSLVELFSYASRNNRIIGGGLGRNLYRLVRYQVKNKGN